MTTVIARDVQAGDVLLPERLTVIRTHDEVIEDSKVQVRRLEAYSEDLGLRVLVRGWHEALYVDQAPEEGR